MSRLLLDILNPYLCRDTSRLVATYTWPNELCHRFQEFFQTLVISSDAEYIFTGSKDGWIIQWFAGTGGREKEFRAHPGGIRCLALSLDNNWLFSYGQDQMIRQWNVQHGTQVEAVFNKPCGIMQVAHDLRHLYVYNLDRSVMRFDINHEKLSSSRKRLIQPFKSAAFEQVQMNLSKDNQQLTIWTNTPNFQEFCILDAVNDAKDHCLLHCEAMEQNPNPTVLSVPIFSQSPQIPAVQLCQFQHSPNHDLVIVGEKMDAYVYAITKCAKQLYLCRWLIDQPDKINRMIRLLGWPPHLARFYVSPDHQYVLGFLTSVIYKQDLYEFRDSLESLGN